jgi:hypothetical protein
MAIFRRVGYFIFICLKDSDSLLFFCLFFSRGHTLHVFHLCFVPVLFSFVNFVVSLCVCLPFCSEAKSFKHMKMKYPTHVKMAMLAETCIKDRTNNKEKASTPYLSTIVLFYS